MGDPVTGGAPADRGVAGAAGESDAKSARTGTAPGAVTGGSIEAWPLRALNRTRGTVLAARLELADSFGSRFLGLMGRPSLTAGTGLWIPGTGSIHMLFMRFPIDAVFLGPLQSDGSRRVVGLHSGLRPWTGIGWARGARGVLEMPAGTIAATGTSPDDEVVVGIASEVASQAVPDGSA